MLQISGACGNVGRCIMVVCLCHRHLCWCLWMDFQSINYQPFNLCQHCCTTAIFQILEMMCDFNSVPSCTQHSLGRASLLICLEVTVILSCFLLEKRMLFTNENIRYLLCIRYFNYICFLAIAFKTNKKPNQPQKPKQTKQ